MSRGPARSRRLLILLVVLVQNLSTAEERETPAVALWAPIGGRDQPPSPLGTQMMAAARLALAYGKEHFGVDLRLLEGSEDGLWGASSRNLVEMVYRDEVVAIVGPADPGAAHAGLQLATRAQMPLVCPAAPDPGLTRAGTPWIFSLLAGDRARAAAIMEALRRADCRSAVVFHGTGRAGRDGYASLEAEGLSKGIAVRLAGVVEPVVGGAATGDVAVRERTQEGAQRAPSGRPPLENRAVARYALRWTAPSTARRAFLPDAVIIWLDPLSLPAESCTLDVGTLASMRSVSTVVLSQPVRPIPRTTATTWLAVASTPTVDDAREEHPLAPEIRSALRADLGSCATDGLHPVALATFDAMLLVARAVDARGTDRAAIREYLAGARVRGITGLVSFRSNGSRDAQVSLLRYAEGRWGPLEGSGEGEGMSSVRIQATRRARACGSAPGRTRHSHLSSDVQVRSSGVGSHPQPVNGAGGGGPAAKTKLAR